MMENPIKMDDLGEPLFSETPICTPENSDLLKPKMKALVQMIFAFQTGDSQVPCSSSSVWGPYKSPKINR